MYYVSRIWPKTAVSGDRLMLRGLTLGDEIIACLCAFQMGKRVFPYQLGHHPSRSRLSPDVAAIAVSIREAIENRRTEYKFLQVDEPYKRKWARRSRRLPQFRTYNQTVAGTCLRVGAKAR